MENFPNLRVICINASSMIKSRDNTSKTKGWENSWETNIKVQIVNKKKKITSIVYLQFSLRR